MIYTFDNTAFLLGKENFLSYYDSITTFSVGYTREVAKENGAVSEKLKTLNFKEVSIGVLEEIFSPKKGLLLSAPYNSEDQSGKEKCSRRLREKYNIPDEHFICLTMCRLVEQKGIKYIIQAIPVLKELNAILLIVGKGDKEYEDELSKYTIEDNVIYIKDLGLPIQVAPMAAGADFYLQPSIYESGGIMPMTMSLYGAIPMVTQVGGFSDNFDEYNAIIIKDSNVINGLKEAATLYKNPEKLREKRRVCMTQNFSWDSRKQDFIKLYESV